MKMIGHQNVSNKFDTESFTAIGQSINKSTAVSVSDKDILATVAPVHHMVIGARISYPQGSCHTPLFTHFIKLINFKDLTPLLEVVVKDNASANKLQRHIWESPLKSYRGLSIRLLEEFGKISK
jgi:hypothetical protein